MGMGVESVANFYFDSLEAINNPDGALNKLYEIVSACNLFTLCFPLVREEEEIVFNNTEETFVELL